MHLVNAHSLVPPVLRAVSAIGARPPKEHVFLLVTPLNKHHTIPRSAIITRNELIFWVSSFTMNTSLYEL